jgi:hypothetical protein
VAFERRIEQDNPQYQRATQHALSRVPSGLHGACCLLSLVTVRVNLTQSE